MGRSLEQWRTHSVGCRVPPLVPYSTEDEPLAETGAEGSRQTLLAVISEMADHFGSIHVGPGDDLGPTSMLRGGERVQDEEMYEVLGDPDAVWSSYYVME